MRACFDFGDLGSLLIVLCVCVCCVTCHVCCNSDLYLGLVCLPISLAVVFCILLTLSSL